MAEKRYSWTQPCCDPCFYRTHRNRHPHRLKEPMSETCVYCAQETCSGIYVRIDPDTAPHPTLTKS